MVHSFHYWLLKTTKSVESNSLQIDIRYKQPFWLHLTSLVNKAEKSQFLSLFRLIPWHYSLTQAWMNDLPSLTSSALFSAAVLVYTHQQISHSSVHSQTVNWTFASHWGETLIFYTFNMYFFFYLETRISIPLQRLRYWIIITFRVKL